MLASDGEILILVNTSDRHLPINVHRTQRYTTFKDVNASTSTAPHSIRNKSSLANRQTAIMIILTIIIITEIYHKKQMHILVPSCGLR